MNNTPRRDRWLISALAAAALAASGLASTGFAAQAEKPAKLEEIPGSKLKRVVLTAKAAERIGIETTAVRQEPVLRWLLVEGNVESATLEPMAAAEQAANSTPPANTNTKVRVRVPVLDDKNQMSGQAVLVLSLGAAAKNDDDDDDDDDDYPGRNWDQGQGTSKRVLVLPIGAQKSTVPLEATPVKVAGLDGNAQYYEVNAAGYRLRPGQQVYVRVPQPGSGEPQTVVPYSAVIYDLQGNTWAYTNPEPLVFVRVPINVEYIEGNLAVIKDGPALGTKVVTAGAAELMGVELKFGQ